MAKTKTGRSRSLSRPRNLTSRRNSNPEDGQGNIENGLYVHSSPPKVVSSSQGGSGSAHIREYLRGGNIAGLEEVVLEGQGPKLLTQSSTDPKVRAFLKTLPSFMSKIDLVHDAAERGDLRDLKTLLDRRKIARSRDSQGMGLMHKAVLSGNTEMVDYLMDNFPETAATIDNEGRTPLHYSAASKSPDAVFNALSNAPGVDAQARDSRGKTASHYMSRPADLKVAHKQKHSGGSRKKSTPSKRLQKVSTPPKREGLNITGANIRIWIHDQDLPKLERIVWEGQGQKLMKETSNIPKVRQFLNLVPRMMIKIKEVHQGVVTGDMEMLETKADQPELLAAKDQNGLNALHKAAALGHVEMCDWIIQRNQSAVFTSDRMGRTPLHYAAIPDDGGETFDTLLRGGADKKHLDRFNKTAEMYRNKPGDLDLSVVYEPIAAPRSGNGTLDIPYSRGPSKTPSRAQSRAASRARPSRSLNVSRRSSAVAVTPRRAKSSERPRKGKTKSAEGDHGDLKDLEFRDMSGVTTEELDEMIRDGDLDTLQMVLLSGKGSELRGKSAWNAEVRQFLKRVPGFMEKVSSLHSAAASGNLKTVRQLTDRDRRLVLARAEDGSVALHHIARSGSVAGVKMIHAMYPDGVDIQDAEGKVPLHYAALSRSPGAREAFEYLEKVGGHADTEDNNGVIPSDYLNGEDEKPKRKPARAKSSMDLPPFGRRLQSRFSVPRSRGASRQPSPEPTPQNSRRNSRSRSKPNSRRNSRATSKNNSPAVSRRNSNVNSKNNSPANSRRGSRANSVGHSTAVSMKNSPTNSAENSPSHSKNNSPSNSREQTPNRARPHGVSDEEADAEVEEEVQSQLKRAESGDFDGLTDLILRGDGHLLVGRGSQDEETQSFLDRVPAILESAEEIHAAAEAGETRKVRGLIDRRKKASLRDSNQSNVLHKAVLHGHSDLVRYLVQSYPELLDQQDRAGRTPLHYAAVLRDGGHTFKTLNKAGADDSVVDRDGLSPADYLGSPDSITEKELKAELKDGIPLSSDAAPKHHENDRPTTAGSSGTRDDDEILNSEQGGFRNVDSRTLSLIDRAYSELRTKKSKSLLRKHLSPSIFEKIKRRVTPNGGSLLDVMKLGLTNPDSDIGVTAVDAESYSVFEELFDPIIRDYHEIEEEEDLVQPEANFGTAEMVGDFDYFGPYVISTRVRCVRNIEGYPFTPLMTKEQFTELEGEIVPLLESLSGSLEGKYDPVSALSETEAGKLLKQFSESANSGRYWPTGRGIFYNEDYTLVILVNDKNHLKIISMEESGNLRDVYDRFIDAVNSIDEKFEYTFSNELGFLTVCPSNLGSAMASSVRLHLPSLSDEEQMLQETVEKLEFRVQKVKEDLDGNNADLFDVSYRWPLGRSEEESVMEMYSGILEIISLERRLENTGRRRKSRDRNYSL